MSQLQLRPLDLPCSMRTRALIVRSSVGHVGVVLSAVAILILGWHLLMYLRYAVAAICYPFELDYGEGIVWQQALLIPTRRMYGDIAQFPFIVFHYPPLYHLVVRLLAAMQIDFLAAGRGVSVASTVVIGALAAALCFHAVRERVGRVASLAGAAVAGLSVFCYWPVVVWSPLFRVDMLAVALCFFGVWCAVQSPGHPRRLDLAVIAFVLAAYTKQTCIAAPLAVLPIMLMVDRAQTARSLMFGLLLGMGWLLLMECLTSGGFLRHIVLYNINRYSFRAAFLAVWEQAPQVGFLLLAIAALRIGRWRFANKNARANLADFRRDLCVSRARLTKSILTLYLVTSTTILLTVGKSGAGYNYFIEWMCVCSVLIGTLAAKAASDAIALTRQRQGPQPLLVLLVPLVLLLQTLIMPASAAGAYHIWDGPWNDRLSELGAKVSDAKQPVLSDDMVLLLKAGKEVAWEPSIFAELASMGQWDERRIIEMITAHEFAFIITRGHAGLPLYDSRYNPAVSRAIEATYPYTEEYAGRTVHWPSNPAEPVVAGSVSGSSPRY